MRSGVVTALSCFAALMIGAGFVALSPEGTVAMKLAAADTKTCPEFPSQAAAQDYYRQNPVTAAHLDANHNGVACEGNLSIYPDDAPLDLTPKDVVDPPPPVTPKVLAPPAPNTVAPVAVKTAAPNPDRPRTSVEK